MSVPRFQLRSVQAADEAFLYRLYQETHGQQFALLPLAPAQRDQLTCMQFDAQRMGYRQQYPVSEHFIIVVEEQPAGRLWVDESGEDTTVIDIVLAPGYQGRGIGTEVLEQVIAKAAAAGRAVRLSVDRMNTRAFELYRKLGFEVCGDEQQMYVQMRRFTAREPLDSPAPQNQGEAEEHPKE